MVVWFLSEIFLKIDVCLNFVEDMDAIPNTDLSVVAVHEALNAKLEPPYLDVQER